MRNLKFSLKIIDLLLQERVSAETLKKLIKKELEVSGVKTKFEFVIFNSGVTTKIKQAILNIIRKRLIQFQFLQIMKEMKNINY
jgi:hypothetical protein